MGSVHQSGGAGEGILGIRLIRKAHIHVAADVEEGENRETPRTV